MTKLGLALVTAPKTSVVRVDEKTPVLVREFPGRTSATLVVLDPDVLALSDTIPRSEADASIAVRYSRVPSSANVGIESRIYGMHEARVVAERRGWRLPVVAWRHADSLTPKWALLRIG